MSRYSYSGRLVADSQHSISIYWLKKRGMLCGFCNQEITWKNQWGKTGSIGIVINICDKNKYAQLNYTITRRSSGKKDDFDYKVPIVATKCYFGGVRYWFICPALGCGKRVAKLYKGQDIFACRHCYNLTYASRNENPTYRGYPFNDLLLLDKIESIEQTMRKKTYKGILTKKAMRVRRLQKRMLDPYVDEGILDELLYKV